MGIRPDRAAIRDALSLILEPDQVTELRAIAATEPNYRRPHIVSGYFDNIDALASAAASITAKGIYFIPNPVCRDCLGRANNRLRTDMGRGASTSDAEILCRRWLLVDLDPKRLADISASDAEHDEALNLARSIADALGKDGWPEPIFADSGNGAHLMYRLPDLPIPDTKGNRAAPDDVLARALVALSQRFDTERVSVDRGVFNPSRIWKLYGTPAKKGDPMADRPHRLARILVAPKKVSVLPSEVLQELADQAPEAEKGRPAPRPLTPPREETSDNTIVGGEVESREKSGDEERPGDEFNRRGDVRELLQRHGWSMTQDGENSHWARPGKHGGTSATLKGNVFFVFSSNAAPFDPDKGYSPFQVFTLLEHEGNHTEAARTLAAQGYGSPRAPRSEGGGEQDPTWTEKVLPERLRHIAGLAGNAETSATEKLFDALAVQLAEASPIAQSAVKEKVCGELKLPRRTYDRQLAEARLKSGKGWANEGSHFSLARQFINDLQKDNRALLLWRETWFEWKRSVGCYRERQDTWILNQIAGWLMLRGLNVTAQLQTNILRALSPFCYVDYDARPPVWLKKTGGEWLASGRPGVWVSFKNGLLDITDAGLTTIDHSTSWFGLVSLPCAFDMHAKAPTWAKALDEWQPPTEITLNEFNTTPAHYRFLVDEKDKAGKSVTKYYSRETQALLQEFAGYVFEPTNPQQVFLMNLGEGSDGKSTWSGIIRTLLGRANVSAVGLEAFDSKKDFNLEPLLGKMLNVTGDANEMERMTEGALKSITGGDACTIKRKFKQAITEVLHTKFILNCNTPPPFRDRTRGIWRRMLAVRWEREFAGKQIDPQLQQKILREELAGVFNWALQGFHAVRAAGFSRGAQLDETITAVQQGTQKEQAYFSECVAFDARPNAEGKGPEYWLYKEDVTQDYKEWCEANNERRSMYGSNLYKTLARYVKRKHPWEFSMLAEWAQPSVDKTGFMWKRKTPPRRVVLRGIRLIRKEDQEGEAAQAALSV